MDPRIALVIFFVVLILLWILIRNFNIKPISAFVLSLLISMILLGFLYNPRDAYAARDQGINQLYGVIWFLAAIIFFLYIVYMAINDKDLERKVTTWSWWS